MPKKPLSTDASSTGTTHSLVSRLINDYTNIAFVWNTTTCAWNANKSQILYTNTTSSGELLHELGHALLGHKQYSRDIELLTFERDAWSMAIQELGPRYNIALNQNDAEDALDTYREWLHNRSICPSCNLNGIQDSMNTYRCIQCQQRWSVNDARICQLKRTRITKK